MLGFARGMKSIPSALLNLVELGPGTRQIGPILVYISTHQLYASHFLMPEANQKIMKLTKRFRGKGQSDPQENGVK